MILKLTLILFRRASGRIVVWRLLSSFVFIVDDVGSEGHRGFEIGRLLQVERLLADHVVISGILYDLLYLEWLELEARIKRLVRIFQGRIVS